MYSSNPWRLTLTGQWKLSASQIKPGIPWRQGGDHARLSLSDELHWHPVLDDEDMYNPAYVKTRERSPTLVSESKVQPSSGTFIIIKQNDIKWRRKRLLCQFWSVKTALLSHKTGTHTVHVRERVKSGGPLLSGSTGSSRQYRGFMQGSAPYCSLPQSRPSTRLDPQHIR